MLSKTLETAGLIVNPSLEELRARALPGEFTTEWGSACYVTRVRSRSAHVTKSDVDHGFTADDLDLIKRVRSHVAQREMIQVAVEESQKHVSGTVRLKLFKGSVTVVGRKSPVSLYSEQHVTFEADTVYDQRDAEGFIKLNALRLRTLAARNKG